MASDLYNGIADALADQFSVTGQTFTWKGNDYGCTLNTDSATIITSKELFTNGLPRMGDVIKLAGKDREVLSVDNASTILVPGGYVEPGTPYVNDSMSPAIQIRYGALIRG